MTEEVKENQEEKEDENSEGALPSLDSREETNRLKLEVEDLTNKWKRAVADYINLVRRHEREESDLTQLANLELIRRLLPVLDGLEKAATHLRDDGLNLVLKKFKEVLGSQGLTEIDTRGMFDPRFHECVEAVANGQPGKIAETLDKGFIINGKIVRAAKVKVFSLENQISENA